MDQEFSFDLVFYWDSPWDIKKKFDGPTTTETQETKSRRRHSIQHFR